MKRRKLLAALLAALCLLSGLQCVAVAQEPADLSVPSVTTESTTEPTPELTTAPTTEPTTASTTEPTPELTTAPTTELTTAPTTEPTTVSTTEPTTEPSTEPTTAPTMEPTADTSEQDLAVKTVLLDHVVYLPRKGNDGKLAYYVVSGYDFSGNVNKLVIRSEVNGYPVKYICSSGQADTLDVNPKLPAKRGESVMEIVIPEGVTRIYPYAFASFPHLRRVSLPKSLGVLSKGAFQNCTALEQVQIQSRLSNIESKVFAGCKALKTIALPTSVRSILTKAFYKSGLTKIKIPDKCDLVCAQAFAYCKSLTKVVIAAKNSFTLEDNAFYGDTALTTLKLPKTAYNAAIGAYAFYGSKALSSVTLPKCANELTVGEGAFAKSGLTGVKVSAYRVILAPMAFALCKSLRRVVFAEGATNIVADVGAFWKDAKLETVKIPSVVKEGVFFGDQAFYGCTALQTITNTAQIVYVGSKAYARTALTNYTVAETVYLLAADALKACKQLKTLRFLTTDTAQLGDDGVAALVKTLPKTCTIYVKTAGVKKVFVKAGFAGKIVVEESAAKNTAPGFLQPFSVR